ncbi:MAG: hypothetical protein R2873_04170 [Caldilineaceae bacterium]
MTIQRRVIGAGEAAAVRFDLDGKHSRDIAATPPRTVALIGPEAVKSGAMAT